MVENLTDKCNHDPGNGILKCVNARMLHNARMQLKQAADNKVVFSTDKNAMTVPVNGMEGEAFYVTISVGEDELCVGCFNISVAPKGAPGLYPGKVAAIAVVVVASVVIFLSLVIRFVCCCRKKKDMAVDLKV